MNEHEARSRLLTIAPEMCEVIEGGEFNLNLLDAADGLYTAEYAEKLKKLSRVKWDGKPKEVPPILLGLPPDSEVIFDGGLRRVDSVIYQFKEQIKRQENGRFELREVAAILANASQSAAGLNANTSAVVDRMKKAFEKGKLRFYDSNGLLIEPEDQKEDFSMYLGWYGDFTTPEAVNAWLESTGSPLRLPESEPQRPPVVSVSAHSAEAGKAEAKPLQRTAAQDAAILCEIEKLGYDPMAIPKNPDGKPGVKAAIRDALSKNTLFRGKTVFKKAWERLTEHGDIVIQG